MPFAPFKISNISRLGSIFGLVTVLFCASCTELKRPEPNPYLSETQPPPKQEFRWANGGMPKNLDPARAFAAPETDVVRAIYEGLTEVDSKTLEAIPGVAEKWSVSDDGKTWTFTLRDDAQWSNGRAVTANDFVRSWNRLLDLGDRTAHRHLLDNFAVAAGGEQKLSDAEDFVEQTATPEISEDYVDGEANPEPSETDSNTNTDKPKPPPVRLDVSAPDVRTLVVKLNRPDKDLAKLVSHPIFRPVYGSGESLLKPRLDPKTVTNGAFKITSIKKDGISLERSETYWNSDNVKLDSVEFVPAAKADEALEAYRTGKVDAVTNADIAPLAQKVFSSYGDFRSNAFAALNYYEVNHKKPPFNDRRVREALAIAIERERLVGGDLEGTMRPAFSLLPFAAGPATRLVQDKDRARDLLEQAGFAGARGFPVIRLVVNRNETQMRIARLIAKMWKDNLNIETEVVVKDNAEIAETRRQMDFDLLRRGVVLPVADEAASISAILANPGESEPELSSVRTQESPSNRTSNSNTQNANANSSTQIRPESHKPVLSQEAALYDLRAIPLYFPTSFALVKPYVSGFELNTLDAPLLSDVSIDSDWQPKRQ